MLACEPRLLIPRDVHTLKLSYVPAEIIFRVPLDLLLHCYLVADICCVGTGICHFPSLTSLSPTAIEFHQRGLFVFVCVGYYSNVNSSLSIFRYEFHVIGTGLFEYS